jgi:dienelactone hydrolase
VRRLESARLWTCRVLADGAHSFTLRVFAPAGDGPHAVVLNGDACWHYATDDVIADILHRGYAFAQFNRVEIAPDMPGTRLPVGALAAWAWGYHRAVDALGQLDLVDPTRIAVVGHSRGGKAALLAGATDERIALTSANNSGAGGAGCLRVSGPGAETLADVTRAFPHWFGPDLAAYAGREHALPFDQHFLKALVAPRALLTTEALDDHWANPSGSWHTHQAARAVYELLGAGERIAITFRPGGHDHAPMDWTTLLDYCDVALRGHGAQVFSKRYRQSP